MGENDAHPLTEDQLDALVDDIQDRLGDSTARKYGRRGVLAALGVAALGTGSASAQASGSVGTASNPVDVEGYDVTASNSFTDPAGVTHSGELADASDVGSGTAQWQEVNSGSNIEPIDGETVGTGSEDVDVGTVSTAGPIIMSGHSSEVLTNDSFNDDFDFTIPEKYPVYEVIIGGRFEAGTSTIDLRFNGDADGNGNYNYVDSGGTEVNNEDGYIDYQANNTEAFFFRMRIYQHGLVGDPRPNVATFESVYTGGGNVIDRGWDDSGIIDSININTSEMDNVGITIVGANR